MTETELMSKYSTRKSFYHKATIIEDDPRDPNSILLKSYESIVAKVDQDGHFTTGGFYSTTTSSHQKEFAKQFADDYNDKKPLASYANLDDPIFD